MFSPRTISFSLVFARPLRKPSRLKLFAFSVNRFRSTYGRSMARWTNSREFPRKRELIRSYRRSMKRKTEPRGRKEIHDRSLCTRSLVLSFLDACGILEFRTTIRPRSSQRWIRLVRDISSIYGSIYTLDRFDWPIKLSIILPKIRKFRSL